VQRWHTAAHREMMREHIKGPGNSQGSEDSLLPQTASTAFSATPTLDAAQEAMSLADSQAPASSPTEAEAPSGAPAPRGAASRQIEEAQLRLALELSKAEADQKELAEAAATSKGNSPGPGSENRPPAECGTFGCTRKVWNGKPCQPCCSTCKEFNGAKHSPDCNQKVGQEIAAEEKKKAEAEPSGLLLRAEGTAPAMMVYLKEHCLGNRVDALPERFESSIGSVVNKMIKSSTWVLLYESITEELTFRAKLTAEALIASNACAIDELVSTDISVSQELLCLPVWRSSDHIMSSLSKLTKASCDSKLRHARCNLIRQVSLEWSDHDELISFLDEQLQPLGLEIDNFRGLNEGQGHSHTPHVADIGRLMFRNFCLLDSRFFRPLCLAAYALVHELNAAQGTDARDKLLELLEGLHAMLTECNVADDHLSTSKDTKETFEELLLKPITSAIERYADWDIRGQGTRGEECHGRNRIYT